ncbi:MAG: T9SS type A sorting domain-containing protein [Bacteroidota bacterium]
MKKTLLSIFLGLFLNQSHASYSWQQLSSLPSYGRLGASGFAIGNKIYFGFGDFNALYQYNDLWEYDPQLNTWTQKASLSGPSRVSACSFEINGYGYVGLGWSAYSNSTAFNSFYRYDPVNNNWNTISNFPGAARGNAVSFVINGIAYVGLGYAPLHSDFYKYNPLTNQWSAISNFPGGGRQSSSTFVLNNYGYVYGGSDGNSMVSSMLRYDATLDSWTIRNNGPYIVGAATNFVIDNTAFLGCGTDGSLTGLQNFYQYNDVTDNWILIAPFPGLPVYALRAVTIGNTAYCFGGGDAVVGYYSNELWKFSMITGIENNTTDAIKTIYNNSGKYIDVFMSDEIKNCTFNLYNLNGQLLYSENISEGNHRISLSHLSLTSGIYIYKISGKESMDYLAEKIAVN